jgi:hypothetical protein
MSESTDYCDVCGLPIEAASSALDLGPAPTIPVPTSPLPGGSPSSTEKPCPNCASIVPADDLFCEVCGYDFTTGALPAPVTAPGGIAVQGGSGAQIGGAAVVTAAPGPGGPGPGGHSPDAVASASSGASSGDSAGASLTWVAEMWVDPDWYATQESDEPCPSAGMPKVIPLWESSVLIGRRSVSRNIHPQVDCGVDHGVSRRHAQLTTDGQRWWAEDLQSSNGTFIGQAGAPMPTTPITPDQRAEFAPGDRIYVGAWTRIVVRKATPDEN